MGCNVEFWWKNPDDCRPRNRSFGSTLTPSSSGPVFSGCHPTSFSSPASAWDLVEEIINAYWDTTAAYTKISNNQLFVMQLMELPTELQRLIVNACYDPWTIHLSNLREEVNFVPSLVTEGVPALPLTSTSKALASFAREAEVHSFTGVIRVQENTSRIGLTFLAFCDALQECEQHKWVLEGVHTIRFSYLGMNPARWKFFPNSYKQHCPNIRRIELNCRYQSLFAVHNVQSFDDFLSGNDGRLERQMDYRKAFFLSDEKFLVRSVRDNVAVRVIREMGVREKDERCQAVVVAIDYIGDENGNVVLDWNSLEWKAAPINGWPHNIRPTLAQLQL